MPGTPTTYYVIRPTTTIASLKRAATRNCLWVRRVEAAVSAAYGHHVFITPCGCTPHYGFFLNPKTEVTPVVTVRCDECRAVVVPAHGACLACGEIL